jgi:hypothetical protein
MTQQRFDADEAVEADAKARIQMRSYAPWRTPPSIWSALMTHHPRGYGGR